MGLVAPGEGRVTIGVVALGVADRLGPMLDALAAHHSGVDFDVVCVVNAVAPDDPALAAVPGTMLLETRRGNLGYTGGLHVARAHAHGEFLVWGQDDMTPQEGWLDALIDAADAAPEAGLVGSCHLDHDLAPLAMQRGTTPPGAHPARWPESHDPAPGDGEAPREVGWVSGAGAAARLSVWDEVGGVNLDLWPLNYVDLDYSVHVRAHGYPVVHAPQARLVHPRRGSTPSFLAGYTGVRHSDAIAATWTDITRELGERGAHRVGHVCAPWRGTGAASIEREQWERASLEFLPLARHYAEFHAHASEVEADAAALRAMAERQRDELAAMRASTSWRVTRPLRVAGRAVRALRRRP